MKANELMQRLTLADPVGDPRGEWAMGAADATALKERILGSPADAASPDLGRGRRPARRRILIGVAAAAAIAVVLAIGGVVLRPTQVAGPGTATAAEVLTQAARAAAAQPPLEPVGNQRIYSAVVTFDPAYGGLGPLESAGETWTAVDGTILNRLTTLSARSAEMYGIPAGATPAPDDPQTGLASNETRDSGAQIPPPDSYPATREQLQLFSTDAGSLRALVESQAGQEAVAETGKPPSTADQILIVVNKLVGYLEDPNSPPALRAAAFEVLAQSPGAVSRGLTTDVIGRQGARIEWTGSVATPGAEAAFDVSVLFDPGTAALLQLQRIRDSGESSGSPQATSGQAPSYETRLFFGPEIVSAERVVPADVPPLTSVPFAAVATPPAAS